MFSRADEELTPIKPITEVPPSLHPVSETVSARSLAVSNDFSYTAPPGSDDYRKPETAAKWDAEMRKFFIDALWAPSFGFFANSPPRGVAYRLPEVEELAKISFDDLTKRSYLQVRPTDHVIEMAKIADLDAPARRVIAWGAFPKRFDRFSRDEAYRLAEEPGFGNNPVARGHDEYCEWFAHKNDSGKITRIDLTSEAPEYWVFLHANEPDTVLDLYRKYVSPDVQAEDLVDARGRYSLYNKWNTTHGAMHLNCPPNSLQAEVYLAAEAAALWADCRTCPPKESPSDVINCGRFGASSRASDPTIGADVNALVRANNVISIEDPVGLFLEDLRTDGWQKPDFTSFSPEEISRIVTYERTSGTGQGKNLRIRVEIPEDMGFVLGDCRVGGVEITQPGVLVEPSVNVFLVGIAVPGDKFLFDDVQQKALVPCKPFKPNERPLPRRESLYQG